MHADPVSPSGAFVDGLLNPALPQPETIKGRSTKRYAVYRNNVTISLIRAMEANFPITQRLLGEQYFSGLAREFVQKHPPQSPLIFHYGDAFSAFLKAQDDLSDYPYLSDIAQLEQQIRQSYHEADADVLSATDLTQIDQQDLMDARFVRHPAMALLQSQYAVLTIYNANANADAKSVKDINIGECVLITRAQHDVELYHLEPSQFVFFQSLASAATLGEATNSAFQTHEDFDLTGAIGLLLSSHSFQSVDIKKD